jgi:transposase
MRSMGIGGSAEQRRVRAIDLWNKGLSVAQISERLGMTKAGVHTILGALQRQGSQHTNRHSLPSASGASDDAAVPVKRGLWEEGGEL